MEVKPPIHAQCNEALNEQTIVSEAVLEESMRWSDRGGLDLRETSEYCDRPIRSGIKLGVTSERGKGVKKRKKTQTSYEDGLSRSRRHSS